MTSLWNSLSERDKLVARYIAIGAGFMLLYIISMQEFFMMAGLLYMIVPTVLADMSSAIFRDVEPTNAEEVPASTGVSQPSN